MQRLIRAKLSPSLQEVNLILSVDKTSGKIGEVFTFIGQLTVDGVPIPSAVPIRWVKNEVSIGQTTTDPITGKFGLQWIATENGSFNFYVEAYTPPTIPRSNSIIVTVKDIDDIDDAGLNIPLVFTFLSIFVGLLLVTQSYFEE